MEAIFDAYILPMILPVTLSMILLMNQVMILLSILDESWSHIETCMIFLYGYFNGVC